MTDLTQLLKAAKKVHDAIHDYNNLMAEAFEAIAAARLQAGAGPDTGNSIAVILHAMANQGVTRAQLAQRAQISPGLIGRYLSGKNTIGMKNAPRIAQVLHLTVSQVLFGHDKR